MSLMLCHCGRPVDTDDDPDSLNVIDGECVCEICREDMEMCADAMLAARETDT